VITSPLLGKRYARVIDVGPHNAPTLLFLHGFAADASCWRTVSETLLPRYRILAPDFPGHGGESNATAADCTMERAAQRLSEILDFLGVSKAITAGYSMGGRLALNFALAHPARVHALVLISASAGLKERSERENRVHADEGLAKLLESDGIEAFVKRWEQLPLFDSLERGPGDRRKAIRRMRLRCSPTGLAASLRAMGTGVQPYLGDRLGELQMPTLLMAGARDHKFTRAAEDMHERIVGSKLATIEDAGHMVHVEQPERFTQALLTFLSDESTQTQAGAAGVGAKP